MGEKDNKKAIDKRKKNLIKEKLKYGKDVVEEVELSWDHYYAKVKSQIKLGNESYEGLLFQATHYQKHRKIGAGMKVINQALSALMRDKIEGFKFFAKGVPKCLLLRFKQKLLL